MLFREFHPRLLRYLRAREARHADDIAGETWVAVASRIDAFEGDAGAFAGWLFTIASLGGWTKVNTVFFTPSTGVVAKIEQGLGVSTSSS